MLKPIGHEAESELVLSICKAAGIDGRFVQRLTLEFDAESVASITVRKLVTDTEGAEIREIINCYEFKVEAYSES